MHRRLLRATCAALALALLSACADATGTPPAADARLRVAAVLPDAAEGALVVEVTAPDLAQPLAFNLAITNGAASGAVTLPAGAARTLWMRAVDADGAPTHRGQATLDVAPGWNAGVDVTLLPVVGGAPGAATVGSVSIAVSPAGHTLAPGDTLRLSAAVRDAGGEAIGGAAVAWATLNAGRATVDRRGLVTARDTGDVEIVAVFAGTAGRARLRVARP